MDISFIQKIKTVLQAQALMNNYTLSRKLTLKALRK